MIRNFIDWKKKQRILIMLAHPDDPEFFCGGTIARWTALGHEVHYWLFTKGEKGCDSSTIDCRQIVSVREIEQREAARELGVASIQFGDFVDGEVIPCLEARMEIVKTIRTIRPDILVSCDPYNRFHRNNGINHPDHLYTGMNVLDAIFPASNNEHYFPDLIKCGLKPHPIKELWLSLTNHPNTKVDITKFKMDKIRGIHKHVSQVGTEPTLLDKKILSRYSRNIFFQKKYYENYFRIIF